MGGGEFESLELLCVCERERERKPEKNRLYTLSRSGTYPKKINTVGVFDLDPEVRRVFHL